MPAIFDTLALPTDRSARLLLIHPVTRTPLTDEAGEQGWIDLYSWESEQAQAHRLARDNAQRKLGREFTAEEEWEDMGQMLARLTKDWHLVGLDGRAIAAPCSFDLAAGAFNATGLRWLRNAVIFVHAGGPALPAATLTSDDLRGDVTIQGSRPRRDLFNGVRAVYVDPAKNWQPTDAPPLLASNYVAEDGGEQIYRDLEFPLTTSVATVRRLMKAELERIRRQREVAFPANLSALRLRPWDERAQDLEAAQARAPATTSLAVIMRWRESFTVPEAVTKAAPTRVRAFRMACWPPNQVRV